MSNIISTGAEFLHVVADLSDASTVVYAYPAILRGCYVSADTAGGATTITNNSVAINTIPVSTTAGQWIEFGDITCGSDITVDSSAASGGTLTIVYKPIQL